MTKTEIKNRKKFISEVLVNMKTIMKLDHYDVVMEYTDNDDVYGEIHIMPDYLFATITLHNKILDKDDYDDNKVLDVITHELTHILTDPLYLLATESTSNIQGKNLELVRESTTEHLSRLIMGLY